MSYEEKIYPELPSAPPEESQAYRLQKISEEEKFLQSEIQTREKLAKKYKRGIKAMFVAMCAIEGSAAALLASGVGVPIGIALAPTGILLGVGSGVIYSKTGKHEKIKTLAESKLDSISALVSKAVEDAYIDHQEYHLILKEIKHYRTMKEKIKSKSKRVVEKITKEQYEAILAQGRKEGEQAFLAKIAAFSDIPTANVT